MIDMKMRQIILILLVCVFLTVVASANTLHIFENDWENALVDFLLGFPTLFDEEYREYYLDIWWDNLVAEEPTPRFPSDAVVISWYWEGVRGYSQYHPFRVTFFDFNDDGIPEAVIGIGTPYTCHSGHVVYQFIDGIYRKIGTGSGIRGRYYVTPQGKVVEVDHLFGGSADSVRFIDIEDGQMIRTDFIGVTGINYGEIGIDEGQWDYFAVRESLIPLPEFDASVIVSHVQYLYDSGVISAPQTSDRIIFMIVAWLLSFYIIILTAWRKFSITTSPLSSRSPSSDHINAGSA